MPSLLCTRAQLLAAASSLEGAPRYYLDTEFESSREGTTLCVVQLSDGRSSFLFDALALDLAPLGKIVGRPEAEWVLHAGAQDLPLLQRALGLPAPPPLLDTQVAFGLLGPEASVSLAYLVYRELGLRTTKAHQTDDWKRRPLPASQLAYAAEDVAHLPALHARLTARLCAQQRLELARAASLEQCLPPRSAEVRLTLESFRHAWQLDAPRQAALRWLLGFLEDQAERLEPVTLEPKVALAIVQRLPTHRDELARLKGLPRRFADQVGQLVCDGLQAAARGAKLEDYPPLEPPPYATWDELRQRSWLEAMRVGVCEQLQVAPDLVLPSRQLEELRRAWRSGVAPERLPEQLTPWRAELLGAAWTAQAQAAPPPGVFPVES